MAKHGKFPRTILRGGSEANIGFDDLRDVLLHPGFGERLRGSHHIHFMPGVEKLIHLQRTGRWATRDPVRQVRGVVTRREPECLVEVASVFEVGRTVSGGVRFDPAAVQGAPIRVGNANSSKRIKRASRPGKGRIQIRLDTGTGGAVFPEPQRVGSPGTLEFRAPGFEPTGRSRRMPGKCTRWSNPARRSAGRANSSMSTHLGAGRTSRPIRRRHAGRHAIVGCFEESDCGSLS